MFLSTTFNLKAQTTTIATDLTSSFHMVANGTDLYVAEYNAGNIVKLDLSVSPETKTNFKTGLSRPNGIAVNGNDLYIAEYNSGKVVKIDLTSEQQTTVITGLPGGVSEGIAFKGNDLYISLGARIVKVPITGTLPIAFSTATEVVTGLNNVYEIVFKGNDLYISDVGTGKILKKDITTTGTTATEVLSLRDASGIVFNGDYLYISWFSNQINNRVQVSRINVEATPIVAKDVVKGLVSPLGLAIVADTLYVLGTRDVSKAPLPCTKPTVTKKEATLTTTAINGATYAWVDCDRSNAIIPGATNVSYTATVNGRYAVFVSKNGCIEVSDCVAVTTLGLTENTFVSDVKLYPNPTTKDVTIELGENYNNLTVEITNFLGQVITNKTIEKVTNQKIVLPINASKGVYFISIKAKEGFARFRVVKE